LDEETDEGARPFDAFFSRRYEPTRRALALMLDDFELAEEAAQEAFARAFVRWPRLESPQGWVVIVGLNFARDVQRRRHRERDHEVRQPNSWGFESSVDSSVDFGRDLIALTPRQREAVVLRYLLDMTTEDIAKAMSCAPGTVRSTLHAALARLRVEVGAEEANEATSEP